MWLSLTRTVHTLHRQIGSEDERKLCGLCLILALGVLQIDFSLHKVISYITSYYNTAHIALHSGVH